MPLSQQEIINAMLAEATERRIPIQPRILASLRDYFTSVKTVVALWCSDLQDIMSMSELA